MYAIQLLEWMAWIPRDQLYLMTLENCAANPVGEFEALLEWMGLTAYGESGFRDREQLAKVLEHKANVAHMDKEKQSLYDREVAPNLKYAEALFKIHNQYLHTLLAGYKGDGAWESISALLEHTESPRR